ncbi:MAG: hypothetical protein WC091_14300 [Sulfuricellaceae bacterium]
MKSRILVLNNFVVIFGFNSTVRTLRAGLHGFPGAWRRCNFSEWNKPFFVVAPLVPRPKAVGYALHPENRTLQPVQPRNLG